MLVVVFLSLCYVIDIKYSPILSTVNLCYETLVATFNESPLPITYKT